jgi:hypothetical protein
MLFRAGDPHDLARALEHVLRDHALRDRIARGAPERIAALCDPAAVVEAMGRIIADTPVRAGTGPPWPELKGARMGWLGRAKGAVGRKLKAQRSNAQS